MNFICKSVTHSRFGDVRIIQISDDFIVYCASDVARMLGFRDPNSAVKNHCIASEKLHYKDDSKRRYMRFITDTDVNRLCNAAPYEDAIEIYGWLVHAIPAAEKAALEVKRQMKDYDRNSIAFWETSLRRSDIEEICAALSLTSNMLTTIAKYARELLEKG